MVYSRACNYVRGNATDAVFATQVFVILCHITRT